MFLLSYEFSIPVSLESYFLHFCSARVNCVSTYSVFLNCGWQAFRKREVSVVHKWHSNKERMQSQTEVIYLEVVLFFIGLIFTFDLRKATDTEATTPESFCSALLFLQLL